MKIGLSHVVHPHFVPFEQTSKPRRSPLPHDYGGDVNIDHTYSETFRLVGDRYFSISTP